MPPSATRESDAVRALVLFTLLTITACVGEPTAPETAGTGVAPQLNTIGPTNELQPLPGTSGIEIADVSDSPSIIGVSGGLPAEWDARGVPTAWATLPGSDRNRPHAIDGFHRTIGEARVDGEYHAVLWNSIGTTVIDLGIVLPPDEDDRTLSIAEQHVAGTMVGAGSLRQAFHWFDGTTTPLPPLAGDTESMAYGVASSGQAAGVSLGSSSDGAGSIVVWPASGGAPDATPFDAGSHEVVGMTGRGRVVISARDGSGVHLWENGVVTELPNPSEDQGGQYAVTAVAPSGRMVGWTGDPQSPRYGVWQIDGSFDLVTPGWVCDAIDAINPNTAWLGCTDDHRTNPFLALLEIDPWSGVGVEDLRATERTSSSVTLAWTQIDDGTGEPARYRVKFSGPPIDWKTAEIGCDRTILGTAIGAEMSCTVIGLDPATSYDFQLMSYRVEEGLWTGVRYSNVATSMTEDGPPGVSFVVDDLAVVDGTATTLTVEWTQVDDGTGNPAWYRVKYGSPITTWKNATIGCDRTIRGDEIGAPWSCTIEGLSPGTDYRIQLMSFRVEDGVWVDAHHSNLAEGVTDGS